MKVRPAEPAQTPKKRVNRIARKPKMPTLSNEEDSHSNAISDNRTHEQVQHKTVSTVEASQPTPTETNPEVSFSMATSVPIIDDFFQDFAPPTPSTTTTSITIAPCPPVSVGVSQPQISSTHTTSLFTDSTATTTTTTSTPLVTVNVSDMGERTYGFSSGVDTTPV